jgi:hypothetical protein
MAFFLESQGHTKTIVNGRVIDDRSYEAVSNSKGTNVVVKQDGKKYLFQNNPILEIPAHPKSLVFRLNSDFPVTHKRNRKTKKRSKRQSKRSKKSRKNSKSRRQH